MRKFLFALLVLSVLTAAFFFPAVLISSGPEGAPYFDFELQNLPERTVFVDLLIPLSEDDPMYVPGDTGKLPGVFSGNDEILRYCEDDYRSYTFHYRDALSRILLTGDGRVCFFTDSIDRLDVTRIRYEHREDILSRGEIRLAMLDSGGNILQVSRSHSLKAKGLFSVMLGQYTYDAQKDELIVYDDSLSEELWQMVLLGVLGLALTCFLEELVAWAFGFGKEYRRLTRWTNLISKPVMRMMQWAVTALPLGYDSSLPYLVAVILVEILAYLCEYLYYRQKMETVSRTRCLLYTVSANAASVLGGMVLFL